MIVWSVLTCHRAAVLSVLSHCRYFWGNWMSLACTWCLCLLCWLQYLVPSETNLCSFSKYTPSLSFVRTRARFVPVIGGMVVPALFCYSFHKDHVDPRVTVLLYYMSLKPKNCCVSIDTASPLAVFLSPITGWYRYFRSILLSQWRFRPASWCGESVSSGQLLSWPLFALCLLLSTYH